MGEDINITYILLPNLDKLVSWYRYEYKSIELPQGFYMIDGGQEDYIRYSTPDSTKPITDTLDNAFEWIREVFDWAISYDNELDLPINKKLKDLDIDYIEDLINENTIIIFNVRPLYIQTLFKMELNFKKREFRDNKINSLIKE